MIKKIKMIKNNREFSGFLVMLLDIIIINGCMGLALFFRFDLDVDKIPHMYINSWLSYMPINTAVTIVIYYLARMYHFVWSYISMRELLRIIVAEIVAIFVNAFLSIALGYRMPIAVYFISGYLILFLNSSLRYAYRFIVLYRNYLLRRTRSDLVRTMVVGAGEAGTILIKELLESDYINAEVCCVIDDNPVKTGNYIKGVKIVGGCNDIAENVDRYNIQQIIVAIPSAPAKRKREIYNICRQTHCTVKTVPGIYQLVNGEISIQEIRHVNIEDLLGRDPVHVTNDEILRGLMGKRVLVTGGGGSIGSELCRQVASHNPGMLIIFDIYENTAYEIQQELLRKYPNLNLKVIIGSVRDEKRLERVFDTYKPNIVFHAAAHKHVPLMEDSPYEAMKNNVFGTLKTAKAAMRASTEHFIFISTDKAVNPTSVMGASKRISEMLIQSLRKKSATEFAAVRFGNVLGSNGSVVPLFEKQIRAGGPVTVTHPDIVRFFMTIPEAVSLVLQAFAFAKGGEIFVLDMGEPVKVDELARTLIHLSGLEPEKDIDIVYTGLRPGEKLYEEILMDEEGLQSTENELIHIGKPLVIDEERFFADLKLLEEACESESVDAHDIIAQIVPTYHPPVRQTASAPQTLPDNVVNISDAIECGATLR